MTCWGLGVGRVAAIRGRDAVVIDIEPEMLPRVAGYVTGISGGSLRVFVTAADVMTVTAKRVWLRRRPGT